MVQFNDGSFVGVFLLLLKSLTQSLNDTEQYTDKLSPTRNLLRNISNDFRTTYEFSFQSFLSSAWNVVVPNLPSAIMNTLFMEEYFSTK